MILDISNNELGVTASILISKDSYRKNTIIKVMYELTDRFFILISEKQDNFSISLTLKDTGADENVLKSACGELANDLIDQELRQIVIEETGAIRDVIVQKAFGEAAKGINMPSVKSKHIPDENQSYKDDKKNILELKG